MSVDAQFGRAPMVRFERTLPGTHLPVLEQFEKQNALGWHTFLDLLDAARRGEPSETRDALMRRNTERYGVDLNNLAR